MMVSVEDNSNPEFPSRCTSLEDMVSLLSSHETEESQSTRRSGLEEVCVSDTLLVPLPPTPYYKIEDKFRFDDLVPEEEGEKGKPRDRCNLYFIAFMVLGAGFHLPFNSFVAAVDYFMLSYNRTNMAFLVASTNSYTVCLAVIINVVLVNRVSTHTRISFGYLAFMISLFSMTLLVALTILQGVASSAGFLVTIGATVFTGVGCGVQEASYYGYAGMLPSKYTRAIMLGESFAGLFVSVNRIVTKLTIEDPFINTVIFFSLSIVGEIVCILLHRYIKKSKFVRYYKAREDAASGGENNAVVSFSPLPLKTKKSPWSTIKEGLKLRLKVSKKIWKLMFGILNVYFVTNLLYPGVASVIHSSWPDGWFPVVLITTFNLSDLLGTLATGLSWKMPDNTLLTTGVLRWTLIPLLLMSVLPLHSPLIPGEICPLLAVLVLGFTTGYMGSTPMCAAAQAVGIEEREMAGNLMTMMMLLGLTLGSSSALVLNKVLGIDGQTEF